MNEERDVVVTRIIKGWNNEFTIQVVKDQNWLGIEETHTGSVPNNHCAKVFILLSKRTFTWENRRGKIKIEGDFSSHIDLFDAAEDRFIKLLGQHLKREYNEEKLGSGNWSIIRRDIRRALRQLVPEKEMKERLARRARESVVQRLKAARFGAEMNNYPHIASELTRLIEEVENK